ncbi:hypothetical protein [Prochlorococcus sp. MIT 1223]|uniref:hypothetical protein n=1 Tax=Prochlorococcus sp. MIT 1223 TaxID=3096217 RepID=UPI002A74A0A6|nr:hypothetical protein [Prochlorococcus sp. MIT 1223]
MSTWLPVTDEIKKKANEILVENLKEKEQYMEEKRGGSISEENIQFLADGVFDNKTNLDNIIRSLTFQPWDSSELTDEQVLQLFNSNPKFKKFFYRQEEVEEAMVSAIDWDYVENKYSKKEIDEYDHWWDFGSEEKEDLFWIRHMRGWIAYHCQDLDLVNSFSDLIEPISEVRDPEDGLGVYDDDDVEIIEKSTVDKTFSGHIFSACSTAEDIVSNDFYGNKITRATADAAYYHIPSIEGSDGPEDKFFKKFFAKTISDLKEDLKCEFDDLLGEFENDEEGLKDHFESYGIGSNCRYKDIEDFLKDVDWNYVFKMTIEMEWNGINKTKISNSPPPSGMKN